jgi:F-type H+-transporting ATPase subunit a
MGIGNMANKEFELNPFEEVQDSKYFFNFDWGFDLSTMHSIHGHAGELHWPFTKFMILQEIVAVAMLIVFLILAKKIVTGAVPRGRLWNLFESMLLFIKDEVAKPAIGDHDHKKFLPFLWTLFFFILGLNLIGMIPTLGAATGTLATTGVLAFFAFTVIHYNGMMANGGIGNYLNTFEPHVEGDDKVTKTLAPFIQTGVFFLEVASAFIRAIVLAVRLGANMMAGHIVLFMFLVLVKMVIASGFGFGLYGPVTVFSVVMVVLLSLLELIVALVQAFVFTFITATFIGMAMHPEH